MVNQVHFLLRRPLSLSTADSSTYLDVCQLGSRSRILLVLLLGLLGRQQYERGQDEVPSPALGLVHGRAQPAPQPHHLAQQGHRHLTPPAEAACWTDWSSQLVVSVLLLVLLRAVRPHPLSACCPSAAHLVQRVLQ